MFSGTSIQIKALTSPEFQQDTNLAINIHPLAKLNLTWSGKQNKVVMGAHTRRKLKSDGIFCVYVSPEPTDSGVIAEILS